MYEGHRKKRKYASKLASSELSKGAWVLRTKELVDQGKTAREIHVPSNEHRQSKEDGLHGVYWLWAGTTHIYQPFLCLPEGWRTVVSRAWQSLCTTPKAAQKMPPLSLSSRAWEPGACLEHSPRAPRKEDRLWTWLYTAAGFSRGWTKNP